MACLANSGIYEFKSDGVIGPAVLKKINQFPADWKIYYSALVSALSTWEKDWPLERAVS